MPISGRCFRADQPDAFVRLLETRFSFRSEEPGDETILRPGVPPAP